MTTGSGFSRTVGPVTSMKNIFGGFLLSFGCFAVQKDGDTYLQQEVPHHCT